MQQSTMRELEIDELNEVSGGLMAFLRWAFSSAAWDAGKFVGGAILSEQHVAGDSCDYYMNMPTAVQ